MFWQCKRLWTENSTLENWVKTRITGNVLRRNQNKTIDKEFVLGLRQEHLTLLHKKYDHYLFTIDTEQSGWIRNPFLANVNTRIILAC